MFKLSAITQNKKIRQNILWTLNMKTKNMYLLNILTVSFLHWLNNWIQHTSFCFVHSVDENTIFDIMIKFILLHWTLLNYYLTPTALSFKCHFKWCFTFNSRSNISILNVPFYDATVDSLIDNPSTEPVAQKLFLYIVESESI